MHRSAPSLSRSLPHAPSTLPVVSASVRAVYGGKACVRSLMRGTAQLAATVANLVRISALDDAFSRQICHQFRCRLCDLSHELYDHLTRIHYTFLAVACGDYGRGGE